MRTVSFVLSPDRGYLDPCEVAFRRNDVVPRYVHNLDVLADESVVMSYEVRGTESAIHESLAAAGDELIDYEVVEAGAATVIQFHYHPCDLVETLLAVHRSYPTLFDFPLVYLDDERTRLRHDLFGPASAICDQMAETRRRVDVSIHRLGAYEPTRETAVEALTPRQREVFETAVDVGYYEVPREATHDDLAAALDCAPSTVGRHLRHIEAVLASHSVPDTERTEAVEESAD